MISLVTSENVQTKKQKVFIFAHYCYHFPFCLSSKQIETQHYQPFSTKLLFISDLC
uniref:Uncharacterized protein n=1 Tax=Rhizophora mucronata TaxID=61149 RepID=A0A2P2N7N1_RHIMU